jgi:hypothetical protein
MDEFPSLFVSAETIQTLLRDKIPAMALFRRVIIREQFQVETFLRAAKAG